MSSTDKRNPIVEVYKGISIRKYERILIRCDSITKKKIIDIQLETGLSERQIVCSSDKPCEKCKDQFVFVYDKDGNQHKIPKGLISKRIPK